MPRMKDDEKQLRAEVAALEAEGRHVDFLAVASRLGIQPGRAANLAKMLGYYESIVVTDMSRENKRHQAMRERVSKALAAPTIDAASESAGTARTDQPARAIEE